MELFIHTILQEIGDGPDAAIPLLQAVQNKYGYVPKEAMELIAKNSKITAAQLFGVATFYAQFRLKPIGEHLIKICHGTACHVRGADRLNTAIAHLLQLSAGQDTSSDNKFTVEDVACLGCCSMAPVMTIDEKVFGNLSGSDAEKAIKQIG